jgi:hypothetical protein
VNVHKALPPTEPIDMPALIAAQNTGAHLVEGRRAIAQEWHRRGLLAPDELHTIVTGRLNDIPVTVSVAPKTSDDLLKPAEPTYGDFLRKPHA